MQSVWSAAVHQVVLLLIQLLVFAVLVWVQRFLPIAQRFLQHHVSQKERALLQQVAGEAFMFAEKAFGELGGQDKLERALNYAVTALDRRGLNFTTDEIRAAIEGAVHSANLSKGAQT